jgi:crossover junction endodeoxyribonuclease RuvC
VVDLDGQKLRYVASGTIRTDKVEQGLLPQRLKVLYDGIYHEVIARYPTLRAALVEICVCQRQSASHFVIGPSTRRLSHCTGDLAICPSPNTPHCK